MNRYKMDDNIDIRRSERHNAYKHQLADEFREWQKHLLNEYILTGEIFVINPLNLQFVGKTGSLLKI